MALPHTRIGIISDTHGLLRPKAIAFLQGCTRIIHGGDIGGATILRALERIAPVTAVRGNNDGGEWAEGLRETEFVEEQGVRIFAIHDLAQMRLHPTAEGVRVIVSGHSHKPLIHERDGVVFINPGSAGPRRFKLPIAIGELTISGSSTAARIVEL